MDSCGGVKFDQPQAGGPPKPNVLELPDGTVSEKLQALFQIEFECQLRDNPEFATQAGFHDFDGELQDVSPQAFEFRIEHNAEVLASLATLDLSAPEAEGGPSEVQRLYAALFRDAVEGESRGLELGCHMAPINSIGVGCPWENFFELLEWMKFDTDEDQKKYLNRLMVFPQQLQSFQDLLAYGLFRRKSPASQSMMRKVPARLQELIEGNLDELRAPLRGKEVSAEVSEALEQAIKNCFRDPLERFQHFVNELYLGKCRAEPGLSAVPDGASAYAESLRFHTTTLKSAQEIHDLGLAEVARLEARFQHEVLDVLGFKGSFEDFAASLKADKANFYDTEEALLDGYKALVAKIEDILPKYFSCLPKMRLEVVRKQTGPAAYYFAGTADGERPGRFYVNVSRLDQRPRYEMVALALHEGVPGHHLQGARALENADLPGFLRYIEDRRYEYGAARRPMYTGYLEGWALYCERLGEEMGMYSTPLELFGRLSMEMMRAVRLVVDTGIHSLGWSVEKAAEYMQTKTGMAAAECSSECHRYAAWPGQACAYKVGELAIVEMRERAEARLGKHFDLPAFHELLVADGPLPLDLLAKRVDAWVDASPVPA